MDDFDYDRFVARGGNLYVRNGLCPPLRLKVYAIRWRGDGINPEFCLAQIRLHLQKYSGWYRCGSGDWGMDWVDTIIRERWFGRRRLPELDVLDYRDEWIVE